MGALSRTLALLVLISLHGGALGLAATGTLSTIGSQEIPKGRSVTGRTSHLREIRSIAPGCAGFPQVSRPLSALR